MRIAIATNSYPPHEGEPARRAAALVSELRRLGHRVLVIAPKFDELANGETDTLRLPTIPTFSGGDFAVTLPLPVAGSSRLAEFDPQIVHALQPFLLGATALRIAASREIPLVVSQRTIEEHGYAPPDSPSFQRFVADLAVGYCRLADGVVVADASVAAALRRDGVGRLIEIIDRPAPGDSRGEAEKLIELYARLIDAGPQPKLTERSAWDAARRRIDAEWRLWKRRAHAGGAGLIEGRHPSRVPVFRHFVRWWRALRRWTSRREWSVRLLDLPVSEGTSNEPGLVILQIDGLARPQLDRALKKGRMPFLARLLRREGYRIQDMYSGQPATTPAVLGELFYGVRQAVPSFGFRDHRTGEVVEMFQPGIASTVERELADKGEPLLKEGNVYCDIYSGGSDESSFCPATTGWNNVNDVAMWRRIVLMLLNVMSLVRIVWLVFAELVVAVGDCIRGVIRRREFWREVLYIPRRAIINIVLREYVSIAAETDVTRGRRIIHANFLGYDENAHRRGPSALFAHYALRGIDSAIRRIWNAAQASDRRSYHVWIMSDHGQQRTIPYTHEFGREIGQAVTQVYRRCQDGSNEAEPQTTPLQASQSRVENLRASWLRRSDKVPDRMVSWLDPHPPEPAPTTVAIGPLGYIYWPDSLRTDDYDQIARRLIAEAGVPLVLAVVEKTVWAWNSTGRYQMPDEAGKVLASNHPYLDDVARDLTQLCSHPDAGDFVISGWREDRLPISFVPENGGHGGPGPHETSGFVLLPPDAPRPEPDSGAFRPLTLRRMAQCVLRTAPHTRQRGDSRCAPSGGPLRLVTYNVHSCIGLDGKLSPYRIARVLAALNPDIVALQELDVRRTRSRYVDQAHEIALALDMNLHFHPSFEVEEEQYGNAILSRFPMRLVKAGELPRVHPSQELRGALWVEIQIDGQPVQLLTTHLGLSFAERDRQAAALLGAEWLGHPDCREPTILCGDFNALPRSRVYRRLCSRLRDAQVGLGDHKPRRTWFSTVPLSRIDHVFVSGGILVRNIDTPGTRLARYASDHLPLAIDLELCCESGSRESIKQKSHSPR